MPEEHRDHGVPLEVMQGSFFEEDVSLVNEDDGAPCGGDLQDAGKRLVDLGRRRP